MYVGKTNANMSVRNKQGVVITSETDQKIRWKEHLEEVLNRPNPDTIADLIEPELKSDLDVDTEARNMKSNENFFNFKKKKDPGNDQLRYQQRY